MMAVAGSGSLVSLQLEPWSVETQMLPSSTTAATVAPSPLITTPRQRSEPSPACSVHDAPKSLDVEGASPEQ